MVKSGPLNKKLVSTKVFPDKKGKVTSHVFTSFTQLTQCNRSQLDGVNNLLAKVLC